MALPLAAESARLAKRSFMARFAWWPDVQYWGGVAVALSLIPAGTWGIWYEVIVLGEYVCFHAVWGTAALITAGVMLFWRVRRLRRFNVLMADESISHFLAHKEELEELVQHIPRRCKRAFKERVEATAGRASRRGA